MSNSHTSVVRVWVSTHCRGNGTIRHFAALSVLLALTTAPLAGSAVDHRITEAAGPSSADPAPIAAPGAQAARDVARPATPATANREIEAVAELVAKRYRVAGEATRQLVGAAYREGARLGIDPLLIVAVMAVESRFNPIAQSDGGAMGLMQVIPRYHANKVDAADGYSVLDPRRNIQLGARVLKEYIRRGGTEIAGLQLYNGAHDDPTLAYANRVLGEKERLKEALRRLREARHA